MKTNTEIRLRKKILRSRADLQTFANIYNDLQKVLTTVEHLQNCFQVAVFVDQFNNWQGGYAVNCCSEDLRYFSTFDANIKTRILKDKNLEISHIAEMSHVWSKRVIQADDVLRFKIYVDAVNTAIRTKKPVLIGGSFITSVWKIYEKVMPHELYFGFVPSGQTYQLGKIVFAPNTDVKRNLRAFLTALIAKKAA